MDTYQQITSIYDELKEEFPSPAWELLHAEVTFFLQKREPASINYFSSHPEVNPLIWTVSSAYNDSVKLLQSGAFHRSTGVLDPMGEELRRVFRFLGDKMCSLRICAMEEVIENENTVFNKIKSISPPSKEESEKDRNLVEDILNSSSSADAQYLLQLNQIFDELEVAIPNPPTWKALRKICIDNFHSYFHNYFSDISTRPTPEQYAIQYTLISCIGAFDKEPFIDSSGKLTEIGDYFRNFAFQLGNYGVSKKYITEDSWKTLRKQLLEKTDQLTFQTPITNKRKSSKSRHKNKSPYGKLILVVIALALLVGVLAIFSDPTPETSASSASSKPASSISNPAAAVLTPVAKPSTGLKRAYDNAEARAPFDVTASDSHDFYLVLSENGKAARCYYIRHGETLSVSVPLGTYSLYYACAPYQSAWYGVDKLWGSDTEFYKSSDVWDFTIEDGYYVGYTLSLSLVSNGNTHSDETSEYTWDSLF